MSDDTGVRQTSTVNMEIPVTLSVDADRCKRDGLCVKVCPARIFSASPKEVPTTADVKACVLCGQCLAVCPGEAIEHSRLAFAEQQEIADPSPVTGEAMRTFLRQRRSVRNYRDRPIPRPLLEEVAEAAGYAPVGAFGAEGWVRTVTIAAGEEGMRAVREDTVAYMRKLRSVLDGPMVKFAAHFSADARAGRTTLPDLEIRLREWDQGRDAVTYNAGAALFVSTSHAATATPHEDCDGALMNMMYAAHAHGLGTCWNGWLGNAAAGNHVSGPRVLGDRLGIPADHHVIVAMTIGWPAVHLKRVPQRVTTIRWRGEP